MTGGGEGHAREVLRSSPDRIRTGVTALRGRRPRPLDDGAEHAPAGILPEPRSGITGSAQTTASATVRPTGGWRFQRLALPETVLSVAALSETNKRGREAHPRCQLSWLAGVPGLEPRLTGPEPVGLPITPYPNGIAPGGRVRSRSLADSACGSQPVSSRRLDGDQATASGTPGVYARAPGAARKRRAG